MSHTPDTPDSHDDAATSERAHKAGAFDVRNFIGALLVLYGLILLMAGTFFTDEEGLAKSDGVNANSWTGVGLLIAGGVFIAWARLRPVVVPADPEQETSPGA